MENIRRLTGNPWVFFCLFLFILIYIFLFMKSREHVVSDQEVATDLNRETLDFLFTFVYINFMSSFS